MNIFYYYRYIILMKTKKLFCVRDKTTRKIKYFVRATSERNVKMWLKVIKTFFDEYTDYSIFEILPKHFESWNLRVNDLYVFFDHNGKTYNYTIKNTF